MKRLLNFGALLLSVGLLGACSADETEEQQASENDKIQVVASFYPMYDFAKNIVGAEGDVELMIPAGTEAHDYEPSAKQLAELQDADVFVYNNENMEVWVPSVEETLSEGDVTVIKATGEMALLPGGEEEHDHEHEGEEGHSHDLDPHVWLAPSLAIKEVEVIRDQLIAAYPEKEKAFSENAAAYLEKLKDLDASYHETFDNAEQKSFVTQHAAFGYLALEYGLNQVPISGLSPSQEPSASRLAELKEYVNENGIKYIYFEENASSAVAETLAEETGVELLVLNPLEGLTDEQIENGEDYISVMEENLAALSKTTNTGTASKLDSQSVEKEKTVYNGYFEDSEIQDRPLSDWSGDWRSVYPYLVDGTLDQVFDYKAKLNKDMSAEEYKNYYTTGYETDIDKIEITDTTMTFTDSNGNSVSSEYKYTGYQVLNYKAGNRGVRFTFEAADPSSGAYKYVQFSDHAISPVESEHFHIYFGNESQEALIEEVDNWPTYYPSELTGAEVAQEMLAH